MNTNTPENIPHFTYSGYLGYKYIIAITSEMFQYSFSGDKQIYCCNHIATILNKKGAKCY